MNCPKCRSIALLKETEECFWYECENPGCRHVLTYDEAIEAEKEDFNRWAAKIMAVNEAMQGWH